MWPGVDRISKFDLTQGQLLAVTQSADRVVGLGGFTESDPRTRGIDELEVTGNEVRVKVSVDHTFDGQPVFLCIRKVFGDVAAGVDHDRPARAFVADEVGRMGEALDVVLLENHGFLRCWIRVMFR